MVMLMGFQWSESIGASRAVKQSDVVEIKQNVDILADNLGITPFLWTSNLSNTLPFVTTGTINELRRAIDYIDDNNNPCSAYYSTYNETVDNDLYSSFDSIDFSTVDNSLYSTYDGIKYSTVKSSEYYTFDSSKNSTVDSDDDSGYYATNDNPVYQSTYSKVKYGHFISDFSPHDVGVDATNNVTVDNSEYAGHCTTLDVTVYPAKEGIVFSTTNTSVRISD
jgi:hypothetical protein